MGPAMCHESLEKKREEDISGQKMRRSIVALTLAGSAAAFSGLAPLVSKTPAIKATSGAFPCVPIL